MSRINIDKVNYTKAALKRYLELLVKRTDQCVDNVVESRPELFSGDTDTIVDPFSLVNMMNRSMETTFSKEFKKNN